MDQSSNRPIDENAGLMRKTADGDINAFKSLFQRFAPLMKQFFVIRGVDSNLADDLVQEVFIRLWQRRKSYRPQASFEAYLLSIARKILYEKIRQSRKNDGEGLNRRPVSDEGKYSGLSQPEAELYFQELTEAYKKVKAKLTTKQRQELDAFLCQDIDFQKVTGDNGCSDGTHRKRLKRALKQIMEHLSKFFTD